MLKIWTVAKNELQRYFISPIAYVYLLSFLILNASFATYFGDFFNRGQADLLSMFEFQPWLYLLFVPGIAMRLWSEEFRSKTIVQIITMPVSIAALVWGKFLAAWIFCGLALILTFPFWITVNLLGTPDNGIIILSYIVSFGLCGCMLAISETISALTKNQIIALVIAVVVNLCFFWSGIEYILSFCRLFMNDSLIELVASLSFLTHFNTAIHGLLELRDVIFFASLIIFFNCTTVLIVNFKTSGSSHLFKGHNYFYVLTAWIMMFLSFMGINVIANSLTRNIQLDASQEKIFTLSNDTKKVLQNLNEPVTVKLYFSPILEQRNSNLRVLFDNIRILLNKYKSASDGKFIYKIYYPKFLSNEEDLALANGVQPIPLIDLNQNALFGLTIEDTLNNIAVIPFFSNSEPGYIEQELTSKIYQLFHQKKNIGIISSQPLFGSQPNSNTFMGDKWEFIKQLEQYYNIVNINENENFLTSDLAAVILFHPQNLSTDITEKIKEYSRQGGKFVVILDPANEASRLYSISTENLKSSTIDDLAKFWGFNFYKDYVVADLENSITVDATIDYNKNPVFSQDIIQFKLHKNNMNPLHPITKNLNEIMFASSSVVMPNPEKYQQGKIKFYPLLKASDLSQIMTSKIVLDGVNPQKILELFEVDDNQKILAAEIIGLEKENPFELVVIADSDFLYDDFWLDKTSLLEREYTKTSFDNANFLLNAVDYLTNNNDLLNIRGKKSTPRRFENIEKIRRVNSLQYKKQEQEIFEEIDLTKNALNEIWHKKTFEERDNFSADELAAIAKIRQKLTDLREQLSNLRYQAYDEINKIASRLKFLNIWLLPLSFMVIYLLYLAWQNLLNIKNFNFKLLRWDTIMFKMAFWCIFIIICAFLTTYFNNYSEIDTYEGKAAFPNLAKQLNKINKIELKSNKETLTFIKENNLWKLQEMPDLPVYQERIRRLLTTASNAELYLKKTNKAENLALFNLDPIENKSSLSKQISFFDNNNLIQMFYLGNIDIDIGRGAKAAFIRFENQFQIWEIKADFVDMNLDWHNWTYANLWDLRYGRIYSKENDSKKENMLLYLMKMMLNTPIKNVINKPDITPQTKIKLYIEDGNYVDLLFYKDKQNITSVEYIFDENNPNHHLQMLAQFLQNKTVVIDTQYWEKIVELIEL